jgi:phosphosulfolactate synthase (CoM biosynthesis protein A)
MKEERGIDSMKYRKSTHLASVDIETIIAEKGECILTIKDAFYSKAVDVSGSKTDGYFLAFKEPVKAMVVNSTNRKKISDDLRLNRKMKPVDARNISNWIGLKISFIVDDRVEMMGSIVSGIRIDKVIFDKPVDFSPFEKQLRECATLDQLAEVFTSPGFPRTELNDLKDELKLKLK